MNFVEPWEEMNWQAKEVENFVNECIRVLRVTKKPSREEFKTIVKVSGLGMMLIGFIGFVVTMIKQVFLK